jgi:hypothetical protein
MPRHPLSAALVLAVAATLALSGCTTGETAPGRARAASDPYVAATTPFTPYWDAMYGVHDDSDEIAKREKVEALVADCMADEGFEYIPVDQHKPKAVTPYMDGYGTEQWAAQHGYGAFPTAEESQQMQAQIESEDPNLDYVESLSESDQGAYYSALQSPPPGGDDIEAVKSGEAPAYDWEEAGCQGRAEHEVNGDDPTRSERFEPLVEAMNALVQDQLADPAMAPIDGEWSECMADAGYPDLPTRQSAADAVFGQSSEYWDSGATDEPSAKLTAGWRAFELEVAVADFRCAEAVDYETKALAVQFDRENRFIADNKPELDDLLAELAQGE